MIIKYFDEFEGKFIDITGATGSTLSYGAEGWTTTNGYLTLEIQISQESTNDPTSNEFVNTLGTYTLTRNAAGDYRITFDDNVLNQGKTVMYIQQNNANLIRVYRNADNEIVIRTNNDGVLDFTSLEIKLYN
jgi:hypothetical protein